MLIGHLKGLLGGYYGSNPAPDSWVHTLWLDPAGNRCEPPIQICDFCSCLHRSGVRVCESCFEAAQCVRMEQMRVAQRAMVRSFNNSGMGFIPEDTPFFGPSPIHFINVEATFDMGGATEMLEFTPGTQS